VLLASALQFDLRESVDRCRNFIIKNGSACLLNATFEAVPEHEVCRLLDFGVYILMYRAPSLASLVPLKPLLYRFVGCLILTILIFLRSKRSLLLFDGERQGVCVCVCACVCVCVVCACVCGVCECVWCVCVCVCVCVC
jgi:hypothetical protein